MTKLKKSFPEEISEMLEFFDVHSLIIMFKHYEELFDLFDVTPEEDWVKDQFPNDFDEIRLIRTCIVVSKIAELFSPKLAGIRSKFPNFYQRLYKAFPECKDLTIEYLEKGGFV